MSGLQSALLIAAPVVAGGAGVRVPSRRGVVADLLSAREAAVLAARFRIDPRPDAKQLDQLYALTQISAQRLYKYFNNQRFTRKRKRKAADAGEEHAQLDCHALSKAITRLLHDQQRQQQQPHEQLGSQPLHAVNTSQEAVAAAAAAAARATDSACTCGSRPACAQPGHGSSSASSSDVHVSDEDIVKELNKQLKIELLEPTRTPATTAAAAKTADSDAEGCKQAEQTSVSTTVAAAAAFAAAVAPAPAVPTAVVAASLSASRSVGEESSASESASSTTAPDSPSACCSAGHAPPSPPLPTGGNARGSSITRLETYSRWLHARRVDPFSCARRCGSVVRLALLVELYGLSSNATSFVFAGACVLQAAFQHRAMEPPQSLDCWKRLLAQPEATALVSRQSDTLWYHVRRDGAAFCESIPTKARDDTLTALAIVAAIAPHDHSMKQLVNVHRAQIAQVQRKLSSD